MRAGYIASYMQTLPDLNRLFSPESLDWPSLPQCTDMQQCVNEIKHHHNVNMSDITEELDAAGIPSLLSRYRSQRALGPDKSHIEFLIESDLQHTIVSRIEQRLYTTLESLAASPTDKTRLISLTDEFASLWLTAMPTEPALRMKGMEVQQASRLRAGLPSCELLSKHVCKCTRPTSLAADPAHFQSCPSGVRGWITRHDLIVKDLAAIASETNCVVEEEPSGHLLSLTEEEARLRYDPKGRGDRRRGDLLVTGAGHLGFVDVTVTHNATESRSHGPAAGVKLHEAGKRECGKEGKYEDLVTRNGYEMVPFALETFGAFGKKAKAYVRKLAERAPGDGREFARRAFERLAITLQRGNSIVSLHGVARVHNAQIKRALAHAAAAHTEHVRRGQQARVFAMAG
jgi:hypothetical protein